MEVPSSGPPPPYTGPWPPLCPTTGVQLLFRMGGTSHVYNSDFSGLWKGNLVHTLHAIPSVESGAISYNQAHLHLVAKHTNIHNRDDK